MWLVEISDFQCPFCKQWHDETFAKIDQEYVKTGKVRMAYLNFPLSRIHKNAQVAAEAAMCAGAQGKFWELHDSLFQTQTRWAESKTPIVLFDSLARAGGRGAEGVGPLHDVARDGEAHRGSIASAARRRGWSRRRRSSSAIARWPARIPSTRSESRSTQALAKLKSAPR